MKPEEYRDLYNRLKNYEDIKKVHLETNLGEELLLVIYTQRISRDVTRNYYKVKAYTKKMVQDWNWKMSFLEIARKCCFSPILTAYFIMSEKGCKRKEFWGYVRDPASAPDKRLQREFREIADRDMVYSPKGMEIQYARGRWGENRLAEWLEYKGFSYKTEKDLRGKSSKTPDCLLDNPFVFEGTKIMWIESKAIFGDEFEFRRNVRKQLNQYTEMFGNGIVVYWFGFCDNLVPPNGVFVVDDKFFEIPKANDIIPMIHATIIKPKALVVECHREIIDRTKPHILQYPKSAQHAIQHPSSKPQSYPQSQQHLNQNISGSPNVGTQSAQTKLYYRNTLRRYNKYRRRSKPRQNKGHNQEQNQIEQNQ